MAEDDKEELKPSPAEEGPKETEKKLGDMGQGSFEETHSGEDGDRPPPK
jgi:hypothetical protein